MTIDDIRMRLVWSAEGGLTSHYNASAQVFSEQGGARIVWIADFLPDAAAGEIEAAMMAGAKAMQKALDRMAETT